MTPYSFKALAIMIAVGTGLLLAGGLTTMADSTTVFGPKDYAPSKGKPLPVTDTFTVAEPGPNYTLRIDNGGTQGACKKRISSAIVLLNGRVVVGPEAFNQQVTVIERLVTLLTDNELTVEVRAPKQGCLTLQVLGQGGGRPASR